MQKSTESPVVHQCSVRSTSSISFEPTKGHQKPQSYCHALSRFLGLSLVFSLLQQFQGQENIEPLKIALHRGRIFRLLQILVHIIPIGAALTEISLNWRSRYLGANVNGLAYFQFAAKAQELFTQASLTAVVLSYIRHEISIGEGLPFGAVFSSFQLTQISYLCSMEFWGAVFSDLPLRRKAKMLAVIILGVSLTALTGPSIAMRLIPNLSYWPAGSTHIWINATAEQLWPVYLDGSLVPEYCSIAPTVSNSCPSSEWQSIGTYLSFNDNAIPHATFSPHIVAPSFVPLSVPLTGQSSSRQLVVQQHDYHDKSPMYDQYAAHSTAQQGAIVDALTTISTLWIGGFQMTKSAFNDRRDVAQSIISDYHQPYTLVSCASDVIDSESYERPVAFPIPPGSSPEMLSGVNVTNSLLEIQAIIHPGITRSQLLATEGPRDGYRIKWVELQQDLFNGTTIGAVVLLPSYNATQDILVCNLSAGWGRSTLNISYPASMGGTDVVTSGVHDRSSDSRNKRNDLKGIADSTIYFKLPKFPQRPIKITEDWANYLVPINPDTNTSIFDTMMSGQLAQSDDLVSVRNLLASLLANGPSRLCFTSQLQGTLKTIRDSEHNYTIPDTSYWLGGKGDIFTVDSASSKDWVKLRVDTTVEGYALTMRDCASRITATILVIYCVFTSLLVTQSIFSGMSSDSWNSIAEFAALAMNSPPTERLLNTCAGISQLHTFRIPVRIRARGKAYGQDDHLELVFGNVDSRLAEENRLRENKKYGTMAPG